jgi:hypothetical protein
LSDQGISAIYIPKSEKVSKISDEFKDRFNFLTQQEKNSKNPRKEKYLRQPSRIRRRMSLNLEKDYPFAFPEIHIPNINGGLSEELAGFLKNDNEVMTNQAESTKGNNLMLIFESENKIFLVAPLDSSCLEIGLVDK